MVPSCRSTEGLLPRRGLSACLQPVGWMGEDFRHVVFSRLNMASWMRALPHTIIAKVWPLDEGLIAHERVASGMRAFDSIATYNVAYCTFLGRVWSPHHGRT